jgi:hypothetical protein
MLALRSMKSIAVLVSIVHPTVCQSREWNDGKRAAFEGEFVECRVVVRLPSGRTKQVEISSLSSTDQAYVLGEVARILAQQPAPVAPRPDINKQVHTTFGTVKLTADEIAAFITECKKEKPARLFAIQQEFEGVILSPQKVAEGKALLEFLSRPNVLIAARKPLGESLFKPCGGREPLLQNYGIIDVFDVLDDGSAYVRSEGSGGMHFIEGVNRKLLVPKDSWESRYLWRRVGTKKVQTSRGEFTGPVHQAVSDEGFPKNIIIW